MDSPSARETKLPQMARALRNPNFRLFWSGNFLSNIGTWMQNVAQGWLVLLLTNSAFWLGVVGFAGSIPFLIFTLFGGVIADRVDKRRLLLVTQTVMMMLAFLLAALAWFKVITVWEVAAIAFMNGVAMSMNAPSYQAMVPRLVKREDLTNAIALNSAQFNMSRILGPTLGGYAMVVFGVAGNFFLNGVSFLAVLWALTHIEYPDEKPARHESMWASLRGGFAYLHENKQMLMLMWMTAAASLFGIPFLTFIPYFAKVQLNAGESGLGLAAGSFRIRRCPWRDDGGNCWHDPASGTRVDRCRSDFFSGHHRIQLIAQLCALGVPGILRRLLRDHDDFLLQCVDPAPVVGRDARAGDEHLCDELFGAAAAGRFAGRRTFAAYSYRPCVGNDGRDGAAVLRRFLCLLATTARTGLVGSESGLYATACVQ